MKSFALAALVLAALPFAPAHADDPKPQSSVAAKTEFAAARASDPAVAGAIDAKDLTAARKLLNKEGGFVGTVARVYQPENNHLVILNFDKKFTNALTAVLKPAAYAKFPDMDKLEGKKVLVTGKFVAYKGRPEIELTDPAQIKIVKPATP